MYLFKLDIACISVKCLSVCCDVITLQHYLLPGSIQTQQSLSFGKQTLQEGLGCLLSCVAAGVFVHCWSSLLSSICCYSLAWKQDQECFHTYAHWPLINKSDRGPFPHIHTTWRKTKSIHMETRSLITETSRSSFSR